jgi:hypothetical protein
MRRARLVSLVATLSIPALLPAQWQVSADAGIARLHQTGIRESSAQTFGGNAEALGDRAWFRSSLLAACASNGCTTQGVVLASLVGRRSQPLQWELSGSVSGFDEVDTSSTGSGELMGRLHFALPGFGGALGLGGGRVSQPEGSGGLFHAQGDAWRIAGDNRFLTTISFVNTPAPTRALPRARTSYSDMSAAWRREMGGVSAGLVGGIRVGTGAAWGSADAAIWLLPHAALVGTVGSSLEDVTRGIPRTRYASIAIRIAVQPHATIRRSSRHVSGPTVTASRDRLEVRVDHASSVDVMGDFTNWLPIPLARDGQTWHFERSLSPGPHRIALRIDGGTWTTPANLPRMTDDLGGVVGLLTVP